MDEIRELLSELSVEHDGARLYTLSVYEHALGAWVAQASWCVRIGARANYWHSASERAQTRDDAEQKLLQTLRSLATDPAPVHPAVASGRFLSEGAPCE